MQTTATEVHVHVDQKMQSESRPEQTHVWESAPCANAATIAVKKFALRICGRVGRIRPTTTGCFDEMLKFKTPFHETVFWVFKETEFQTSQLALSATGALQACQRLQTAGPRAHLH